MICPACRETIPDNSAWCRQCGATFRFPNPGGLMLRAALVLLVAVSLSACGMEPDAAQAPAYPVETCTVVFMSDGTITKRDCIPWQTADAAALLAAGPTPVTERCTVQILEDGTLKCVCEAAK